MGIAPRKADVPLQRLQDECEGSCFVVYDFNAMLELRGIEQTNGMERHAMWYDRCRSDSLIPTLETNNRIHWSIPVRCAV